MNDYPEITRAFAGQLELDGDGRTIYGRCVPYNAPRLVADPPPAPPVPYTEAWCRGAFRGAVKDPRRVRLNFMHQPGLGGDLGRAVSFTETDDGLDGVFRVIEHGDGDKALSFVRDGSYRMLSIHAAIIRSRHRDDGVIERQAARLLHVALVDEAAFPEAQVTAVRGDGGPVPGVDEIRAAQDRYRLRFASSADT